uniref:Ubiquitin-conjugating enzyme E2 J2 n=1 Tax=Phallusia mammillata TaxID=59560 RepID=A0A6F9DVH4_9ASCI|nr:ubiquitin-conjugating enzyme E2 J2-like [Phallusia mammillata]
MSRKVVHKVPLTATQRLKQDYIRLKRDPVPYVTAEPLPSNILEWHYVVRGPEDTPYFGGYYHGKLVFPREFPFRPPAIYMITPNGRFKCNQRLCLSISDFHPDTWNPAWSVTTILTGLLSFMVEETPTLGSVESSVLTKQNLASCSHTFNLKNDTFCELFPEIVKEMKEKLSETLRGQASLQEAVKSKTDAIAPENAQQAPQLANPEANRGLSNVFILIAVAAFGLVVNNILKSQN